MSILKVRCPECGAVSRHSVDPVDTPTEVDVTCPKCECEFSSLAKPEESAGKPVAKKPAMPVPKKAAKPVRAVIERDEDEEDEDRRPRRKSKPPAKSNALLVAGIVGGVLLVGGAIAAVALSGSKNKDVAKVDPPPAGTPVIRPGPNLNVPPRQDPPVNKPPVNNPPLAFDDQDVFARALAFKLEGPLPELPALPPVDQRPMLALNPGGHTTAVKHTFFTPNSRYVITVGEDKAIRVWDVFSGEGVGMIPLPSGPDAEGTPESAALSPDGKRLAVGVYPVNRGKSGVPIYLISLETGELVKVISAAREVPGSLDFSPDGKFLVAGCNNGMLRVIEVESDKLVFEARAHAGVMREVRANPKQMLAASLGKDKEVKVWALNNPAEPLGTIKLGEKGAISIDWSHDGKTLVVGCVNGEAHLFDLAGKLLRTVPPMKDRDAGIQLTRLRFLPGDKKLAFSGIAYAGWAGVIDVATGERPAIVRDHTNTVFSVTLNPNGRLAASCGGEFNETLVWDTATGTVLRKFAAPTRAFWSVGWGKDGKSLAWGTVNRHNGDGICPLETTFRLDDFVSSGAQPDPAEYQRQILNDGTFSVKVDDFFRFTVSENGKRLYQYKTETEGNRIYSVSILPGKGIVVGASHSMCLIDTKSGKQIRRFLGDTGLTTALAPSPDGRYFISGSTDQVVRVWSPDQTEPLVSIFQAGREWIAWTPQGYYACSPYGERLIGWQVNRGIDKLPEVHPAVRFRASLYQPNLLKYLIPAGNLQLALAMAAKYDQVSVAVAGLADVLPPRVTVTAPATIEDTEVEVKATAEGSARNPIVAMRLLVDGRPYLGAAGIARFTPGKERAEATWKVALTPGIHSLAVLAESPVSKGLSPPAVVTRAGNEELPNLYVLAVGVSDYAGDMKLNFAASDAFLLKKAFEEKSKGVFGTIEVRTITDKEATKRGILEGLDWLGSRMKAKDVGIFSFSGHGGRDPGTGQFFLCPVDMNDTDPLGSCLAGDEFKKRLENMPGRLVAMLDACHSGAAAGGKPKPTTGRPDNLVRDLLTDDYGVVVMCSSQGSEYSMESPATKAGFFTLAFTEGMGGRADINKDGIVYIHELDLYAGLRVGQLSGGRQNPTTGRPPTIRPFPIAKP